MKAVGITVAKASNELRIRCGRYLRRQRYDTLFMSNYLDVYVKDALKRVPGVADVIIFGERKYSMRLWLDPVRMAGRGLTAPDVVTRCRSRTWKSPRDRWDSRRQSRDRSIRSACGQSAGYQKPAQFDNIILKTNADGTLVRLKDVGRAELGAEDYGSDLQFNGQDAVGIGYHAALQGERA